ncbi:MAG: hypothetical protein V1781_10070 [Bacteroidota bacterium]
MKTFKIILPVVAIMLAMAVSVISCKKKEAAATEEDTETNSTNDNTFAERTSDDIVNMAGEASDIAVGDSAISYRFENGEEAFGVGCATVKRDTVKKITITFNGQTCLDGHIRSGSLTLDYSSATIGKMHYRNPGFKLVITSSNYIVDGNKITINKTISNTTNSGFNPATTNLTWSITSNISIIKADGSGTITWKANRVKELLNTSDTNVYRGQVIRILWNKARVGITGNASGTTAGGESFAANITKQLVRDMTCSPNSNYPGHHPFIQGTADFTRGSKATRYIDYGDGTCDNIATVTIKGVAYTITLQ